jgi:hypothetical protein
MIHKVNDMASERGIRFWIAAVVGVVTNGVSVGYASVAVAGGGAIALYAESRSVALLAAAVGVMLLRSSPGVLTVVLASAVFQGLDAVIGLTLGYLGKTIGPAMLSLGCAVVGWVLSRRPRDRTSVSSR